MPGKQPLRASIRICLAALLAGGVTMSPPAARAQVETREGIELQNQIQELRRDIQELHDQGGAAGGNGGGAMPAPVPYGGAAPAGGAPVSGDMTAQLLERVQTLEDQVRTLRGQVEELQNQSQRQQADFSKQLSDLSFQMQQGGHAASSSGDAPPPPPAPQTSPQPGSLKLPSGEPSRSEAPSAPARRTADTALQEGNAALARRDYAAAEAAAREVLSAGRGPRAYDAQFLLAQAEAGQRNYQQAAIAFDDTYNRNRAGSRAQDSLLGLAHSLYSLGDKSAACGALNKLRSAFPSLRSDIRENVAGLRGRAGCG